jgi:subtilase family serine protease
MTPLQVRHAYGFDQIRFAYNGQPVIGDGSGQTIAIVNAYDNSRIFSDVDHFDQTFGIGGGLTLYQQYGASSRFLTKANPEGTPLADPTGGLWNLESALDVEWAHAIAPGARILLVQSRSNSLTDLLGAVDYARNQPGVGIVSMSWGVGEFSGETYYDYHFTTPANHLGGSNGKGGANLAGGITFVAASGDHGAPGLWPAMSTKVLAVGGTTLTVDSAGNYLSEVAWSGSGGGISTQENKTGFQAMASTSSSKRTQPDVAYEGDPSTGVYVYYSLPLLGRTGTWWQVGGTSAGAPQWAALVAIADQGRALQGKGSLNGAAQTLTALYNMPASDFHDVTKGYNGYYAGPGYDLATGRGTPYANRVVADLVRTNALGQIVATASISTTSTSGTIAVQPHLFVAALQEAGAESSMPVLLVGASDMVVVLNQSQDRAGWQTTFVADRAAERSIPASPKARPESQAHTLSPSQVGVALAILFGDPSTSGASEETFSEESARSLLFKNDDEQP